MFYQGGITAYNLGQKYMHLDVEPIHAQQCNCVSRKVADEMALNVCKLLKSNWGISITGYATPSASGGFKLFAFFAIAANNKIVLSKKITPKSKEPFEVQLEYARVVLKHLSGCITNK